MPTRGKDPDYLVDTSVAVALVVADHSGHKTVFDALGDRRLGIAGGSVYDALVGYAAKAHGAVLAACDARARDTYRNLDVAFEFFT